MKQRYAEWRKTRPISGVKMVLRFWLRAPPIGSNDMTAIYSSAAYNGNIDAACRAACDAAKKTGQKVYHRGNGFFEVRPCNTRSEQARLDHIRWVMSLPSFD